MMTTRLQMVWLIRFRECWGTVFVSVRVSGGTLRGRWDCAMC